MSLPWIYSLNKRTAKIWFPTGRRQINCRRMSIPKKRGTLPREIRDLLDLNLISDETRFDTPLNSCICFHWLFQRGGGRRFIRRPLWPPWAASSSPKQRVDCPALPGQPASGRRCPCRDRNRNHPSIRSNTKKYQSKQRQALFRTNLIVIASTAGFQRDESLWA